MKLIFHDDFQVHSGNFPANWRIEKNSDMELITTEINNGVFSLLSPGDKFLPVISPCRNAEVKFHWRIPSHATDRYDFMITFRYDEYRRQGECIRICAEKFRQFRKIEFGQNIDNSFVLQQSLDSELTDEAFDAPLPIRLCFEEQKIRLELGEFSYQFESQNQPIRGGIAISRGIMFCKADVSAFEIFSDEAEKPRSEKTFRVNLPLQPVIHPLYCDCTIRDFGTFLEAELALDGGVRETPLGEGNYHGMRKDVLDRPYFKVIRPRETRPFTLYDGTIISVTEELAPEYFYGILFPKFSWPIKRILRFPKTSENLLFAIGAEEFYNSVRGSKKLIPGETLFDENGTTLYSGKALTNHQIKIVFRSQPDKKIRKLLPKSDPRFAEAVRFTENNHYFLDEEAIHFSVELTGLGALPKKAEFLLEDVFFNPLKKLSARIRKQVEACGFLQLQKNIFDFQLPKLRPGVYHLRCRSCDPCFPEVVDYCAFEVIDPTPGALPPPLLSGLPFLYNSRSETRGLETDSFDPWRGESVDDGHYIACANFQPKWARDYQVMPTVRAYQRKNFLWLGTRNCDHPTIAENVDLVKECDYLNCGEEFKDALITWISRYQGKLLKFFLEFAIATGDSRFDLKAIRSEIAKDQCLDLKNLLVLEKYHWTTWVEHFRSKTPKMYQTFFTENVLSINPEIQTANYGPSPIYASHYKGVEQTRYRTLSPASLVGFWQVEDYPRACRYGLERSTYYMMSCLLSRPGERFCPEIYTGGSIQGCPDGAVNYAHPPYGQRGRTPGVYIKRRILEYALAAAVFSEQGFRYWQDCGFQACDFWRDQFEGLLQAFKLIREEPPKRPLRSMAFCWSEESWKCPDSGVVAVQNYSDAILDVRTSKTENVPFLYEEARKKHLTAGFLADLSAIDKLTEKDVDTLLLPPLKGVPDRQLAAIRKLHARGVHLVGCENVAGLEDLFGVADTGKFTRVEHLKGSKGFLEGQSEFCSDEKCQGSYRTRGARVLLQAEIPALTLKKNGKAYAAFFNLPPTFVNVDRHIRLGYGRNSISPLINNAAALLLAKLDASPLQASDGLMVAYRSQKNHTVVLLENPSENESILATLSVRLEPGLRKLLSVSVSHTILGKSAKNLLLRLAIPKEETAVLIFQ
ncbi:MAG: hypothetical protein WCT05_04545 [Lentisphaeria bacterium]